MKQTTVWLNTHLQCIAPMRQADAAGEFRFVTSYRTRKYQTDALMADHFELEPAIDDEAYVDYALDFVHRHGVNIFLPGRKMERIARRADEFAARGVKVILAGDVASLEVVSNKGAFYDALQHDRVPIPRYIVAQSVEEFAAAVSMLQREVPIVCFKPTVGVFGQGFKIVGMPEHMRQLLAVDPHLVTTRDAAIEALGSETPFRPQIVMAYLAGPERSLDCLAQNGKLVRTVVRYKLADGSRILEHNPQLEAYTRRLTERFALSGLFNVQFKDDEATPYVLEINARMSGGIGMSCLSGVVLPYWALRLALGNCSEAEIPMPRSGLRVAEVTRAIVLGDAP